MVSLHTVVVCIYTQGLFTIGCYFLMCLYSSPSSLVEVGIFELLQTPVKRAGGTEGGDELSVGESHFMDTVFTDYSRFFFKTFFLNCFLFKKFCIIARYFSCCLW